MFYKSRKLILITGLPRSGTTVIGDLLAAGRNVTSIYEPFNPQTGDDRIKSSFVLVGSGGVSFEDFDALITDISRLRLNLRTGIFPHDRGVKKNIKLITGSRSLYSYRLSSIKFWVDNLVWKDPFANFCIEEVLSRGIPVVVAYRPPKAIAASYKRLNWRFDVQGVSRRFGNLGLKIDAIDLEGKKAEVSDEVRGAVLLWLSSVLYYEKLRDKGLEFQIVPAGSIPSADDSYYLGVFDHVAISGGFLARAKMASLRSGGNSKGLPDVPKGHPHRNKRNAAAVNTYWDKVLTKNEAEFIDEFCFEWEARIEPLLYKGLSS